jgi:hypothetical protein
MSTERQRSKVKKVMHEHKHGALKSGSGHKVKKPKAGNCDRDVRVRNPNGARKPADQTSYKTPGRTRAEVLGIPLNAP